MNNPKEPQFEPTVFNNFDYDQIKFPGWFDRAVLQPYISLARSVVRFDSDIVMLTHLLLYFTTSVPSAIFLFRSFSWARALLHVIMQASYMGTYTLMM